MESSMAPGGGGGARPRRRLALAAAALGLLAGAAWVALRGLPGSRPPRPNLVLLVWDTARADRVGGYGSGLPTTPFLDSLAAGGARFDQAFAPAPWTAPSHASLFTGLAPRNHGLVVPRQALPLGRPPLLAETLAAEGYETAGFSANPNVSALTGLHAGFETFRLYAHDLSQEPRSDLARRAVREWLDGRRAREASGERRPVFLFVNLMEPHLPLAPDERCLAAVRPEGVAEESLRAAREVGDREAIAHTLGIRRLPPDVLRALRVLYDGGMRQADETTREILGMLREAGLLGDAVVAVTSDHGESLGEHGALEHRFSLREPLLRIPLVVHAPGRVAPGTVIAHPVALQDLHREFLDRARAATPDGAGLDAVSPWTAPAGPGRALAAEYSAPLSLLPAAREWYPGAPEGAFRPFRVSIAAARSPHGAGARMKYLRYRHHAADGTATLDREELFDLSADPGEESDLLGGGGSPAARAAAEALRPAAHDPP